MMNTPHYHLHRLLTLICGTMMLATIAACNGNGVMTHKLVATGGQHTVPMYPDEQTFLKVASKAQQSGVGGAIGGVQKEFAAKDVDDQTSVRVISSDSNGAEVEITDGPLKGQTGFVAPQNVD